MTSKVLNINGEVVPHTTVRQISLDKLNNPVWQKFMTKYGSTKSDMLTTEEKKGLTSLLTDEQK